MAAVPQDAATVMILRDGPAGAGVEVLMVRRAAGSRFVPGAFVFPGGRIEEADCSPRLESRCEGLDAAGARARIPDLRPPHTALGAWVAAIRETFEEVGLLFACPPGGAPVALEGDATAAFERWRRSLHAGRVELETLLEGEGLRLAAGELRYFAHWITPEASPIRFDVRFFVARAPPRQVPRPDGFELTEHRWVAPREALEAHAAGSFPLVLPTRGMLGELAGFRAVEDVWSSAREKEVPVVLSRVVLRGGERVEVMPDDRRPGDQPCGPPASPPDG